MINNNLINIAICERRTVYEKIKRVYELGLAGAMVMFMTACGSKKATAGVNQQQAAD